MNLKKILIFSAAAGMLLVSSACSSADEETFHQAETDLKEGNYQYALSGYEDSVAAQMNVTESYRGAGIACMGLGQYEQAEKYFNRALEDEKISDSFRLDTLRYKATAQYKQEKYQEAYQTSDKLAQSSPKAQDYLLMGLTALGIDSYDEAEENFQKAIEEDSSYSVCIQIYDAYVSKDMEADGSRYLEQALQENPKDGDDYYNRGKIYFYMEDYSNAEKELKKAVEKENSQALLLLGKLYLQQEEAEKARTAYEQYNEMEVDSSMGYNGLALCDIEEGNYDSALDNIQKGLEDVDTDEMQDLYYNQMVVYEKKRDFVTALEKAEEYLSMFPNDEAARKEYDFLWSRVYGNEPQNTSGSIQGSQNEDNQQ